MKKYESILLLQDMDFNVPDCILIKADSGDKHMIEVLQKYCAYKTFVGIRTQKYKEIGSPCHVVVPINQLYPLVCKYKNQGYDIIINEGIDTKDCKLAGCASVSKEGRFIVEIKEGPVSVREITHKGNVDYRHSFEDMLLASLPYELNELKRLIELLARTGNFTIEFSMYNIPVGVKKEKLIFWEVNYE